MGRLTADLILRSDSYINPIRQRELNLRGNKIPAIENLGATLDSYDGIDLSDNEVGQLQNFPLLTRLCYIFLNNNHITKISTNLGESLPNLDCLILTNNRIVNLHDLDSLADLPSLRTLSLIDNVVAKKPNYRLYVIHRLPQLRILDFKKIKSKERAESEKFFGPPEQVKAKKPLPKTFVPGRSDGLSSLSTMTSIATTPTTPVVHAAPSAAKKTPAPADNEIAIKAAIESARTMEEVHRLERALQTGQVPAPMDVDAKS